MALVVVAAFAAYANTFSADFTLDDVGQIRQNALIRDLSHLPAIWTTNYWGHDDRYTDQSLYRPLTVTSFAINAAIGGLSPWSFHVVNVLLHAATCLLLFALVGFLFENQGVALVAALLFAVHPIHTEVVAGIVGRAEILALCGGLLCAWAYFHALHENENGSPGVGAKPRRLAWLACSLFGYFVAVFSKEIGAVAPGMILLTEALHPSRRHLLKGDRRAIVAFAGYAVIGLAYLALRQAAVEGRGINVAWADVSAGQRFWTALRVCLEYVGLLIAPVRLSASYWCSDVPLAGGPFDAGVILAVAVFLTIGIVAICSRGNQPSIAWGIGLFLLFLLPVSNLFFAIGVLKAERLLYAPSAGFCVVVAALLTAIARARRARLFAQILTGLILVTLFARTWVRNQDWKNDYVLAQATLRTSPDSPVFNTIYALELERRNRVDDARVHLRRAIDAMPAHVTALYNLGKLELRAGDARAAIDAFQRALVLRPEMASALNLKGRAHAQLGEFRLAEAALRRSIELEPDESAAYVNLLSVYIQLKAPRAAEPLLEEALRRFPKEAAIHWNAHGVYTLLGDSPRADEAKRRAIELNPALARRGK